MSDEEEAYNLRLQSIDILYETANVAVNIIYEGLSTPLATRNDLNIGPDTHQRCTKLSADNASVEQHAHVYPLT